MSDITRMMASTQVKDKEGEGEGVSAVVPAPVAVVERGDGLFRHSAIPVSAGACLGRYPFCGWSHLRV